MNSEEDDNPVVAIGLLPEKAGEHGGVCLGSIWQRVRFLCNGSGKLRHLDSVLQRQSACLYVSTG